MAAKKQTIIEIIEPIVHSLEYELWGIELLGQNRVTLRIYIDSPNGIDVDDCAKVSRQVSSVLDVEDPISSEYTLEVSSPGMDRPLFKLSHYTQYIGHIVKIRLRTPYEGRRNFTGQITSVEGQDVVIHVDSYEYLLPFSSIEKAYIVPNFR